jgi:hypothetical protein
VQFLKWAFESRIGLIYNILVKNPGERPEWYHQMTELIPFIEQLPAPTGVVEMHLERFSRYHTSPETFGIKNVRPMPYYADLYPDPKVDLPRIAYVFAYDHQMQEDEDLNRAQGAFVRRVEAWRRSSKQWSAFYVERHGEVVIRDRRSGVERTSTLSGTVAEVFRYLDQVRSLEQIRRRFAQVDEVVLECLLESFVHKMWIARDGDRYLAVLPNPERGRKAESQPLSEATASAA